MNKDKMRDLVAEWDAGKAKTVSDLFHSEVVSLGLVTAYANKFADLNDKLERELERPENERERRDANAQPGRRTTQGERPNMKKIYYSVHNIHPRAVLASKIDNGSWTVENEAKTVSIPLNEDGFRYAYRDEPRDGDEWLTNHEGFGGTESIARIIADGAEPRWLTTKEEVEQWAEKHPKAWFLDLNILVALKREDLPWGHMSKTPHGLQSEENEQWALPLVVLVPAEEVADRQG